MTTPAQVSHHISLDPRTRYYMVFNTIRSLMDPNWTQLRVRNLSLRRLTDESGRNEAYRN